MKPLQDRISEFLRGAIQPQQIVLLAFSGGLDSTVLLDLLASARQHLPFQLHAIHIHHGLSPNADAWADFCAARCADYGLPYQTVKVHVPQDDGLGIEAAARQARYQVLFRQVADHILLAHHQDDQAETLLLQLLRGAGLKGLAGMAMHDNARRLMRPLLDTSRSDIQGYAQQHRLQWIEDESNGNIAFDRNYCRHQIMPVLEQRYPAARATLARSAMHLAEGMQLLDELAQMDAQTCIAGQVQDSVSSSLYRNHESRNSPSNKYSFNKPLNLLELAKLSDARAKNLLRWWLESHNQSMPSSSHLQQMLKQLLSAKPDASLKIKVGGANVDKSNADVSTVDTSSTDISGISGAIVLRRYQHLAYVDIDTPVMPIAMTWQGEQELTLPDGSVLLFEKVMGAGLAYTRLCINKLRVSQRLGGERFKPDLARPTRTLKHLLQEAEMLPWLRERLPLIYCDDTLAVVPGIGVACTLQAGEHEEGLVISWRL